MQFEITSGDHLLTLTGDAPQEAEGRDSRFATEHELNELAGQWPMQRLVELWNRLPGVQPVSKFENRKIAIARIWRAIGGNHEPGARAVPSRRTTRSRIVFREGSKAAQVCCLLSRAEGATLSEIRTATDWQAHTVRGFISRTLRKQGRKVQSFRKNGERVYRLKS
jgi:hypothetical protein